MNAPKARQSTAHRSTTMFWTHVNKRLSSYLHGELRPEESRRVAEHLMICRRCRDEYEEIKFGARLAARLSDDLARAQAPAALWSELEKMIDEAEATPKRPLPARRPLKIALAGAAALALALVVFWFYPRSPRP